LRKNNAANHHSKSAFFKNHVSVQVGQRNQLNTGESSMKTNNERRSFLKQLALGLTAVPLFGLFRNNAISTAFAADAPEVSEKDPTAIALGYVSNGKKADVKKFPKAKDAVAGKQPCKTCMFFSNENNGKGNCQLFPGKVVQSAGWCNSWTKKA